MNNGVKALSGAGRAWVIVAVIGQLVFAFSFASLYGSAASRGHFHALNRSMSHGYVPGETFGNLAVGLHLLTAVLLIVFGALQLSPGVRRRAPRLHRWSGRIYMGSALVVSLVGLFMLWARGSAGDVSQRLGTSGNALVVFLCAVMAWRAALARNFESHRQWALRLFLAGSGVWFFRVGLMFTLAIAQGPVGFDPRTFEGPLLTAFSFGQYLVPIAVLEVYLRAQKTGTPRARLGVAVGLGVLTLATAIGILMASVSSWGPNIKLAYERRISISDTLAQTIETSGIDVAIAQYRAADATRFNLDETELNTLGYELARAKHFKEAIRIFTLNVEAYPQSGNAYDSLAEAHWSDGDLSTAIVLYKKSLELKPDNVSATRALDVLTR